MQSTMTMQYSYDYRRPASGGGFFVFLLALILGAAAMALFVRHATTGAMARLAARITGRPTMVETSSPVVVQRLQRLSRLETVVYSLDTIVEGSKSSAVLPDLIAGDRILLVVHGQSVAGVDLAALKPEDVKITEDPGGARSVRVTLPPSQVFLTSLDNQHTRVYARSTGILVPADQNLESETRAKAEQQLQQAALHDGILDAAAK